MYLSLFACVCVRVSVCVSYVHGLYVFQCGCILSGLNFVYLRVPVWVVLNNRVVCASACVLVCITECTTQNRSSVGFDGI